MAEAKADNVIRADDEIEGEREPTEDFVFVRIGDSLPLKASDSAFDLQNPPSQPLAISQRHRLLFLVHSEGFFVAKTDDVIESAKEIKEKGKGPSVEGASIMDVKLGRVSILSLSEDEETLAAAVGGEIFFFSTLSLLKKEQDPSFSCSITNSGMVKDFKWQKDIDKSFLVLFSHGSLHHGTMEAQLKAVMGDVDAVDWSRDGIFVAVARKHTITILSANFKEVLSLSLFFQSWAPTDSGCTIKVDSIKWVRDDSIIVGSFQVNKDGEEDGYLIQIITSKENKFSEVSCHPIIHSFPDILDGVWDVLPNGSGPYLIATLLDYWEIVLASNQKTIDQHILLFKWSKDSRREVLLLDIINDKYKPKIDLQENGDDNLLLGLAVDKFSSSEKIVIQTGATEFKELPSRCALLCLTSEGKLILYHAARISEPSDLPQKLSSVDDDNSDVKGKHSMASSSEQSATRLELEEGVDGATSDYRLKQINIEPLNSHEGLFKLGGETISPKRRQDGGVSQVGYFTGQIGHLNKSSAEAPVIPQPGLGKRADSGSGIHMFCKPSARVESSTSLTASKTSEPATAIHAIAKNGESRDLAEGILRPNITQTTGKLFGTDFFSAQRSAFSSSVPLSNFQEKNNFTSEFQSSSQSFSSRGLTKQPASTMFSSRQTTPKSWLKAGDAELTSTAPSSVVHAQEGHLPGKVNYSTESSLFENIRISKLPQALNSEPEISKQFYNVNNMAQELDILLSSIEKDGGFRDACTKFQKSSLLALENGLEALSERSRECKKMVEEQLMAIQQLQNKMLQVSARQVYMKGIVEQASDRKYWEIWNRQKLNPELEAKWKNILNANQNLTDHIIELERHFNTLEINRFGGSGKISQGQSVSQSGYLSSRQNQSLHSVYTTLNSQLTAAQHLSRCLSEQMSELNISSAPLKVQSKKKELFESIGLSPETTALESPDFRRLVRTPDSVRKTPPSTTSSVWKGASSTVKAPEPETGRRRRDSLDRNWTTFEPPKTTVKRTVQKKPSRVSADEPFRKAKHVYNSQLEAFTMQRKRNAANIPSFQYILSEGMQDSISKQAVEALPNSFSRLSRDISNSSEISGSISHPMAGKQRTGSLPPSMPQTLSTFSSFSSSTKEVSGSPDMSSRNATKAWIISDSSAAKIVSSSSITSNKQFEASNSVQSSFKFGGSFSLMNTGTIVEATDKTIKNTNPDERTLPARPLNTFSPQSISIANEHNTTSVSASTAFTLSGLDTVQLNKSTRSSQSSKSITNLQSPSSSVPFSFSTSPAAASSKTFLTPASKATISFVKSSLSSEPAGITNQTDSVPTPTSTSDNHSLPSSSTISCELQNSLIPTSTAVTPTKTFGTSSSSFDANCKELNQMASVAISTSAASSSNHSLSSSIGRFSQSQKLSSVSTPVSAEIHSPTGSDPTAPVTSASPDSVKLDKAISQAQPASTQSSVPELAECMPQKEDNLIGKVGDNMTLPKSNSQPETPSSTVPLTGGTEKDGVLDASLSQEDEMEEEAPDTTAVLSLGALGGFGFGSTPSAPKPNPFGGSFLTASSTAASSPISFPASSPGEPFRPASFTLPSAQPVQPSQPASSGGFSGGFGGGFSGFGQPSQVGVGQPAQAGAGQQALGSVLGSFGQSRQLGTGMQGVGIPSSSAFGGGGFSAAGGFATAGTGGFASVGSAGGGFAAAGKGGGFAAVSTSGGFAGAGAGGAFGSVSPAGGFGAVGSGGGFGAAATGSGGFAAAATGGGGFGAPATGSGGFAVAATGGGFASGGFAAFGSGQGGGGFSAFGGNSSSGAGKPPAELLTQMRK